LWIRVSGSGPIGIIWPDPDRDRHPGPADPDPDLTSIHFNQLGKKPDIFPEKFPYTVQNTKNCDAYDTDEKDQTNVD
jgi:hypothetical protein